VPRSTLLFFDDIDMAENLTGVQKAAGFIWGVSSFF
jgi:hypothetical protein